MLVVYLDLFILYVWVYCLHVCLCMTFMQRLWSLEGVGASGTGDTNGSTVWVLVLSMRPVEEKAVFLISEPSLQLCVRCFLPFPFMIK